MSPTRSPLLYDYPHCPEDRQLGDNNMSDSNLTLKQKAYHEMKEFFVIACYLWLVFALLVLYKSVILSENHIPFAAHGLALLNALALAKVMLVARGLHLARSVQRSAANLPDAFQVRRVRHCPRFFQNLRGMGRWVVSRQVFQ
jgi:hypothetical protein